MIAAIAEYVARPWTTMDDENRRQRLGWAITFDVGRKRQIGNKGEAVARFALDGVHRREPVLFQFRSSREELGKRLFVSVQEMIGGGLLWRVTHDDPATIVIGLALHVERMTGQTRFDQGEFRGDLGRQGGPFLSPDIDTNRLWRQ